MGAQLLENFSVSRGCSKRTTTNTASDVERRDVRHFSLKTSISRPILACTFDVIPRYELRPVNKRHGPCTRSKLVDPSKIYGLESDSWDFSAVPTRARHGDWFVHRYHIPASLVIKIPITAPRITNYTAREIPNGTRRDYFYCWITAGNLLPTSHLGNIICAQNFIPSSLVLSSLNETDAIFYIYHLLGVIKKSDYGSMADNANIILMPGIHFYRGGFSCTYMYTAKPLPMASQMKT